jgi:hypothetical protein
MAALPKRRASESAEEDAQGGVHVLRHKVLVEGRSQRQVAKELGISRLTVRKYLAQAAPVRREAKPRARPVWDTVGARVETLLRESVQWTGGKQQLTATRLHELLVAEGHLRSNTTSPTAVECGAGADDSGVRKGDGPNGTAAPRFQWIVTSLPALRTTPLPQSVNSICNCAGYVSSRRP